MEFLVKVNGLRWTAARERKRRQVAVKGCDKLLTNLGSNRSALVNALIGDVAKDFHLGVRIHYLDIIVLLSFNATCKGGTHVEGIDVRGTSWRLRSQAHVSRRSTAELA
jgi:hypothetical protein